MKYNTQKKIFKKKKCFRNCYSIVWCRENILYLMGEGNGGNILYYFFFFESYFLIEVDEEEEKAEPER